MESMNTIDKNNVTKNKYLGIIASMLMISLTSNANTITSNNQINSEIKEWQNNNETLNNGITISKQGNTITVTIDETYGSKLWIIWEYTCTLTQDKDNKNYNIFYSNIDKLSINEDNLIQYCKTNGLEDLIEWIYNHPQFYAETIAVMCAKDINNNELLQSLFNYLNKDWNPMNACWGNQQNNNIGILPYNMTKLSIPEQYEFIAKQLEDTSIDTKQREHLEWIQNKLSPEVFKLSKNELEEFNTSNY